MAAAGSTQRPGPRAVDTVTDALRARILAGEIAPGTPLREEDLSATYEVSRHTSRTALSTLTAERLVVAEPYRGMRVARLDEAALRALQQLRCALETEALQLVRERAVRPPQVDDALDQLQQAERAGDWPATVAAHSAVHLALVSAAESPRIWEAYRGIDAELRLALLHTPPAALELPLWTEHRRYVSAALAEPALAVRAHLELSTAAMLAARGASS